MLNINLYESLLISTSVHVNVTSIKLYVHFYLEQKKIHPLIKYLWNELGIVNFKDIRIMIQFIIDHTISDYVNSVFFK